MEEKKISIFKKIENSFLLQVVFFVVSMVVIVSVYIIIQHQIGKMFEIVEDDFSWVYQIDEIMESDNQLVLSGWAFELNRNAKKENCDVILYDVEKGSAFFPKMKYVQREDVNTYFLCEFDYIDSGFIASIDVGKLNLGDAIYEVLLRPTGTQKSFRTGIYYAKGEMLFINPAGYESLDIEGTDLETIVREGVLRVYRPDYGMYVYQYEGELYWIAEEDYGFVNGDSRVQFQMNTTQIANLTEERLGNGWFWSNIGFDFTSNEITDWNAGKYRVAKCALPREYSITKIWTGNYIEEWIWRADFRPWYEFE